MLLANHSLDKHGWCNKLIPRREKDTVSFYWYTERLSPVSIGGDPSKSRKLGSGCGSVGRAVAFDTRGPWFDSSRRQNFIEHLFIIKCLKRQNK